MKHLSSGEVFTGHRFGTCSTTEARLATGRTDVGSGLSAAWLVNLIQLPILEELQDIIKKLSLLKSAAAECELAECGA